MLTSLNSQHPLDLTVGSTHSGLCWNLLCGFSLLPENWLCLPTEAVLLRSQRLFPWENRESLPFPYRATLGGQCLPHFLQKVLQVLGALTIFAVALSAPRKWEIWHSHATPCLPSLIRNRKGRNKSEGLFKTVLNPKTTKKQKNPRQEECTLTMIPFIENPENNGQD